jgi:diaminohydroxyphosphoribosylaminopyrimidine deaminase/5-amino-6-(5-phosphoribosylamino)uracil reductase
MTPSVATPAPSSALPAPWAQALALAAQAIGLTDPNPRVGCVIVSPDGRTVLGAGHTQQAGGPHAEVMALRDAAMRGAEVRGATVYVTLEPCAHHGRTPPCCDALIAAGVGAVHVALRDPNPLVDGQGRARLLSAGIPVHDAPPEVTAQARELNIGFLSRMQRGRPWVRLKIAASLDGRTALPDGSSRWITGPAARADGHAWRARAGVVLTGIGTVRDDEPRLDVREVHVARQPLRAVIDARLETRPDARLLAGGGSPVLLYTLDALGPPAAALRERGAELVVVPGAQGRIDLAAVLADLHARAINEVHVEAGARLNGAWLAAGLVDELLVYVAPSLLGDGRPMALLPAPASLDQSLRFAFLDAVPVGDDLRVRLRAKTSA